MTFHNTTQNLKKSLLEKVVSKGYYDTPKFHYFSNIRIRGETYIGEMRDRDGFTLSRIERIEQKYWNSPERWNPDRYETVADYVVGT